MEKVCKYITPIFFYLTKNDLNIELTAKKSARDIFTYEINESNINDFFYDLFCWCSKNRYVFIGSKKNFNSIISPETAAIWEKKLIKKVAKSMFGELFNFLDIDSFYEQLSDNIPNNLDEVEQAYKDILNAEVWGYYALNHIERLNKAKEYIESLTWYQMMIMGLSPNEIFQKCGNHMLPSDFTVKKEQDEIEKKQFLISCNVNKMSFISEFENKSILNSAKVFYIIDIDGDSLNLIFRVNNGDSKIKTSIGEIDDALRQLNLILPSRRVFITFGKEAIDNAKYLYELTKDPLFLELMESSVDYKKPFEAMLNPTLEEMLNYFSVRKSKSIVESLQKLDEAILKDIKKSFEILNNAVMDKFSTQLPISDIKKDEIKKQYGNMINSVLGQALKFLYSHFPS